MGAWTQDLTLTEPGGLSGLLSGLSTLATAANATLDAAGIALDAAKVFLSGTAAPQAAAAAALVSDIQAIISDLFGAGFFQIVVHPWTPGVGRGEGPWRHLSFPQAVRAIRESFDDQGDAARPQFSTLAPVEMIALVAGAPSPSIFKTTLEALNVLIDVKEFRLAIRRIEQAFDLEDQRFTLPEGSKPPDWQSVTVREAFPALAPLEDSLHENLAMLEGYALGAVKAVDIAGDLVAAKKQQLTDLQTRLNAAAALFGQGLSGAGAYGLHIAGTGGNDLLKNELNTATGAPGPELSFCAGLCWVGPEGTLTPLKDVLGL